MKNRILMVCFALVCLFTVVSAEDATKTIVDISRVESSKEIVHSSDTGGKIKKIHFDTGAYIKRGSIVVEIQNEQIEAAYRQSESQYETAKINYEKAKEFAKDQQMLNLEKAERTLTTAKMSLAKAQKGTKQEQLDQLKLNVDTAKTNFETAKKNFDKNQLMYNDKLISEQIYLQVKSQYEGFENTYKGAEKALELAKKGTDDEDIKSLEAAIKEAEANYSYAKKVVDKEFWQYDINTAEAAMNSAKAAYDFAKTRYDDLKVKSEYSGLITAMDIEEGNKVLPGRALFTVSDNDTMILRVGVPEKNITSIKKNGKADVFIDTINKTYKGVIESINPIGDEKTKKFEVKVKINNSSHTAKDGMHGEVTVYIN